MAIATTTIGPYPKPDYIPRSDKIQFNRPSQAKNAAATQQELEAVYDRAIRAVVREQVLLGIDVPAEGEIRRDHSIDYVCRHLTGFDWSANTPTVTAPIGTTAPFLPRDWRIAQEAAMGQPVKISIPGPLTIALSVADSFYGDEKLLSAALSEAFNTEIRELANAGCIHIQIDEPVFVHQPEKALAFGFENLERCLHRVPKAVISTLHICGGAPPVADAEPEAYPQFEPQVYFDLADAIEYATIQAIAIADARRPNPLALLETFAKTTVVLGVVDGTRSQVEPVDQIANRLQSALEHIDAHRLMAAPDCGLHLLDQRLAVAKLKNIVTAARTINGTA